MRRRGEEEKKRRGKIEIEKMRRLVKQGVGAIDLGAAPLTRVLHSTGVSAEIYGADPCHIDATS
jgi:hypothetical protein